MVTNAVHQKLSNIEYPFDSGQVFANPVLQQYTTQFIVFNYPFCEVSDLAKFWNSFLDMVEMFVNLLCSTRTGKWSLYIEAVRNSLLWFFAYDRPNYSHYLTAHYELLALEANFSEFLGEFQNGNFSIQMSTCDSWRNSRYVSFT